MSTKTAFSKSVFHDEIKNIATSSKGGDVVSRSVAEKLDEKDPLAPLRAGFILPTMGDANVTTSSIDPQRPSLYFCGNSLGPLTVKSKQYLEEQTTAWGRKGVLGHWDSPYGRPWTKAEERVSTLMSDFVGAKPDEVIAMATLTANLHTMLRTFYRPKFDSATGKPLRHKIIYEAKAFPSDQYALASHIALSGLDPATSLVKVEPRKGERILHDEDIIATIEREAKTGELAMVMLAGIQYMSGQLFDIERITRRAKELGVVVGWDLAHAFANVPLALHDWGVDFAVWCTYKYGCSGPGGIGGLFVHERWAEEGMTTIMDGQAGATNAGGLIRPAGWWGHVKSTRFAMPDSFQAMKGAAGWQLSNPSMLDLNSLLGSLETLAGAVELVNTDISYPDIASEEQIAKVNSASKVGSGLVLPILRSKSQRLTAYLELLLLSDSIIPKEAEISIVTPSDPSARGSQLSICIPNKEGGKSNSAEKEAPKTNGHSNGFSNVPPPVSTTTRVGRVHKMLETQYGVICDVRNPDMLRLAPLAHFSTFKDVWDLADALRQALNQDMDTSS